MFLGERPNPFMLNEIKIFSPAPQTPHPHPQFPSKSPSSSPNSRDPPKL